MFEREKIIDLVEREIQELKNVKLSFQMQVKFSRERNNEAASAGQSGRAKATQRRLNCMRHAGIHT